ncbi:cob(II)yrinic acid a,c-diamide reductase [Sinobacterium caligoides]|uniref:Cob(II)yrinic acid a,c-diamide reductase n=1 Tax=Sinobacterium caligoides TaxID=933926 RepID=A0A3N2DN98_9GAMM|nr:5,6-dimethylbenzimidazole synthase [Sinobacterium caligoides]ROS01284.1 cob(II)yrinic acid a,c-diamide reductase [Sinobacterium caligoides]
MSKHRYSDIERDAVYKAIFERRDMRHFTSEAVDPAVLQRLLVAAHHAPSVGFMQPWRFIRITDRALRGQLYDAFAEEVQRTAEQLSEKSQAVRGLKLEGIREAGEILVVTLQDRRDQYVLGRRTMPEMDLASASCAIQNMWLAARAEGLGLGWVSIFEPDTLRELLSIPDGASPIAILCIGHVDEFYPEPMLATENWRQRLDIEQVVMENQWQDDDFEQ